MPEDLTTDEEQTDPGIVHDDIMKRLLDYQRHLRDGLEADEVPGAQTGSPASDIAFETERSAVAIDEVVDEPELIVDVAAVEAEATADGAATPEIETGDVVEIPTDTEKVATELWSQPSAPTTEQAGAPAEGSSADLEARMARLEDTLDRLGTMLGDLRITFQEMAIAADERLAAIEATIADSKTSQPAAS